MVPIELNNVPTNQFPSSSGFQLTINQNLTTLDQQFCLSASASNATELEELPFCKIWIEQCEAAQNIEAEFGKQKALDYLVGEKFINFLEASETDTEFRAEIPSFVAKIKTIFEPRQLATYLETARETEPFAPELFEPRDHPILGKKEIDFDAEEIEDMRKDDIRQCTRDLLLVERAKEWLLEE